MQSKLRIVALLFIAISLGAMSVAYSDTGLFANSYHPACTCPNRRI